jgi:hypothetical protein
MFRRRPPARSGRIDVLQPAVDVLEKLTRWHRLREDGDTPQLAALAHDVWLVTAGERDRHARPRGGVAELFEDTEAAPVGEREVEQHEIDRLRPSRRDGVGNGANDGHPSTGRLEENAEGVAHVHIVLDHEDVAHPRRLRHGAGASGNVKKKRLPMPSELSTQMRPP